MIRIKKKLNKRFGRSIKKNIECTITEMKKQHLICEKEEMIWTRTSFNCDFQSVDLPGI